LIHDPQVLILDEPTDGLDPNQKHEVRRLINELSKDKLVIVSTHILEEVHEVCTRAIIIANGRIVADETPTALESRSRYHHAVSLRFEKETELSAAMREIPLLPEVAAIESDARELRLTALPKAGANVLSAVSAMIDKYDWDVPELHLESGRLDEVFRALTNPRASMCPRPRSWTHEQGNGGLPARIAQLFRYSLGLCFHRHLPGARRPYSPFQVGGFLERNQADLQSFFRWHPVAVPGADPGDFHAAVAEERNSGSIELLMTFPLTLWQAVVGKFSPPGCFAGIALLLTFPVWDHGQLLGISRQRRHRRRLHIGSFLMAGGFLAIGMCSCPRPRATRSWPSSPRPWSASYSCWPDFRWCSISCAGVLPQTVVDAIAS